MSVGTDNRSFRILHILLLAGILVFLAARLLQGDGSANVVFFLFLAGIWFLASLALGSGGVSAADLRHTAFAMADIYVLVSCLLLVNAGNQLLAGVLVVCMLALTMCCGAFIASAALVSGALAGLNGSMFQPGWQMIVGLVLLSELVGLICGIAWRVCMPVFWRCAAEHAGNSGAAAQAVSAESAVASERPDNQVKMMEQRLSAMQRQLEEVSRERDEAQERLAALEEKTAATREAGKAVEP